MSPKIVDKENKKLAIMHAAMNVFSKKGLVKTKMTDIAESAGIGKGTIYEYFRSKEEIFDSAFSYFFKSMNAMISEALVTTDDPVEQLRLLVDRSLKGVLHEGSDFAGIMMDFWAEGIRNKDQKIIESINLAKIYEDFRHMIGSILEGGIKKNIFKPVDTLYTSAIFIAAFDGIILQWIMDRELIDLEKVAENLVDNFMNGILK